MASSNNSGSTSPNIQAKLDLSDSSSHLPSNLFQPRNLFFNRGSKQNTPKIQQLLLRRNRLESLQSYAKVLLQFKQHLTELSLRENSFSRFPAEILVLKNLTSLSLAFNQLEIVERDTLSQLINLQWLNLSNNKLKDLPIDIVCCHNLRGLDLENNNFTSFPPVIFYLTRLEVLMVQKNKIRNLPASHDFPSSLHTLNLAFNQLTQVPTTLIHNPPTSLTHLHLSGSRLHQLPHDFLFTGYEQLVSLDLHTCQLTHLSSHFFQRLSRCRDLRRLNLAINRLTDLPDTVGLVNQLQWLNLNDNQLTYLPASLSQLTELVKLGLVQNQLCMLPPLVFMNMLQLQKLDIRRNRLKYLPPSMLALAPFQEVDMHVDLSVPCQVFAVPCQPDDHPYGGSLRTLLFYENPTVEHVDGILCHLDSDDEEDEDDCVQVISMAQVQSVLQQNGKKTHKQVLRQALMPQDRYYHYSHHSKFRRSEHPISNLLSEIDEDDDASTRNNNDDDSITTEEKSALQQETRRLLTQIPTLRELCLRTLLTSSSTETTRYDEAMQQQLIHTVLPNTIVPTMLHLDAMTHARQCDYCTRWYAQSRFQVGYLARLCNYRLQVPVRFDMCSMDCAVDAVSKLYQAKVDWQSKQSLAQMDVALLPSAAVSFTNGGWRHHPITSLLESETGGEGSAMNNNTNNENDSRSTHFQQSSSTSSYRTVPSASTNSTRSTISSGSSSEDHSRTLSFTRTIRNRVTQLASNIFIGRNNNHSDTSLIQQNNSAQHRLLPLVFPNLNLGVPTPVVQPHNTRDEPPALVSITSRLVEGRLQTERTQPQLRLSTPLPSPTAFNHLPRDAIRLEKF